MTITLVLRGGRREILSEVCLDLHRRDRDAVDEESQVEPVFLLRRVTQFGHDAQDVPPIEVEHRAVAVVSGRMLHHAEPLGTDDVEPLAQYRERSATLMLVGREGVCEALEDPLTTANIAIGCDDLPQVLRVI